VHLETMVLRRISAARSKTFLICKVPNNYGNSFVGVSVSDDAVLGSSDDFLPLMGAVGVTENRACHRLTFQFSISHSITQ